MSALKGLTAVDAALSTRAVRAGIDGDNGHGAVVPPLVLSSNFSFADFGEKRRYDYSRSGNPTRDELAWALADLEGGAAATVTASGMAAVTLALQALLQPGQRLLVPHDAYGGCWRLFDALARKGQFEVDYCDFSKPSAVAAALHDASRPTPTLVWLETPSNPLLRISDIHAISEAAHAVGAIVLADNTFLSPALQRPIELGADLVLHSTTKYINGHSDVVGGALIAADPVLGERIDWWANALGLAGSPFDSFLTLRGLRTLDARLRVHQENTAKVVDGLARHEAVDAVYGPGLSTHPGHLLAARQQDGFGAMLSFELAGGEPAVRCFLDGLRHFTLAESLGGVESLVAHPATMTHASMSADARRVAGISDGLLRLSVGIEHGDDLREDVVGALDRVAELLVGQQRKERRA